MLQTSILQQSNFPEQYQSSSTIISKQTQKKHTISPLEQSSNNKFKKWYQIMVSQTSSFFIQKFTAIDSICNEIVPNLYLGSFCSAVSKQNLKNFGITHVLSCYSKIEFPYADEFVYKLIDIEDNYNQNIMQYFEESNKFIDDATAKKGKVLVHCFVGKSRSATLIMSYMIYKFKLTTEQALKYVKFKRSIAQPNLNFMNQLKLYELYLTKQNKQIDQKS